QTTGTTDACGMVGPPPPSWLVGLLSTTGIGSNRGQAIGVCAETMMPLEKSGTATSTLHTVTSRATARTMGQRLRRRAPGADSSKVSGDIMPSILGGLEPTAGERSSACGEK